MIGKPEPTFGYNTNTHYYIMPIPNTHTFMPENVALSSTLLWSLHLLMIVRINLIYNNASSEIRLKCIVSKIRDRGLGLTKMLIKSVDSKQVPR